MEIRRLSVKEFGARDGGLARFGALPKLRDCPNGTSRSQSEFWRFAMHSLDADAVQAFSGKRLTICLE